LKRQKIMPSRTERVYPTEFAQKIFSRIQRLKIELYVSALSIVNINCLIVKVTDKAQAKQILQKIKPLIHILPLNDKIIQLAFASDFNDFEDAIQYYTALEYNITTLITRDLKDFKKASINVMTAQQYLGMGR